MKGGEAPVTRRAVVRAAAWSVPVLALAVATPAVSASVSRLEIQLITPGLAGGGYEFYLREGKNNNSLTNTNVDPNNQTVIVPVFRVVNATTGLPATNVSWSITGDNLQDGQGHYVLGFFDLTYRGSLAEPINSTKRVTSGVSPDGSFSMKMNTVTWSREACLVRGTFSPPGGTFTVVATASGFAEVQRTFTALVRLETDRVISCP